MGWTRPYRDVGRILSGSLALGGALFIGVGAAMIMSHWDSSQWRGAVAFAGFSALWLTIVWRLHRTALLVSDHGVRVRWLLVTRTFPWTRVRGFRSDTDMLTPTRLWIDLDDGTSVRTPIQLTGGSSVNDGGTKLPPDRYGQLLEDLEQRRKSTAP